jgi:hypothetical protein
MSSEAISSTYVPLMASAIRETKAISGNQWQSEAISGNQMQSAALTFH